MIGESGILRLTCPFICQRYVQKGTNDNQTIGVWKLVVGRYRKRMIEVAVIEHRCRWFDFDTCQVIKSSVDRLIEAQFSLIKPIQFN
jgi:hypothetical protein